MLEVKPITPESLNQPNKDKELVGALEEIFDTRINAMREHYRRWQLNLAFERGRQWSTWDRLRGKIVDLRPSKSTQARIVFNLIGPFVRSTISMLSQSNPTMDVMPASYSAKDERAARSAQVHLDRIDIVNQKAINDVQLRKSIVDFGTAFKLIYWDSVPNMEDLNPSPPGSLEELEQMGKPPEKIPLINETEDQLAERLKRGEVGEVVCTPFEILLDYPLVKQDSDIRDFIRYRLVSMDYIKNSWKRGKFVTNENVSNYQILGELLNSDNDLFSVNKPENQAVFKEYFEAPSKKHPRGRHIQWANGVLLHDGILSHPKGKLGLLAYHWEIDPTDFYGESYVKPLIEPQVIVNRIFSKLTNWLEKSVRFRIAVPKNSQFSKNKFASSQDGSIFEYNNIGGTGAINIPIAGIPPGLFEFLNQTIENFKDLASRHEVSKGMVPGRVESGKAIRSLQEADSQYLVVSMIVWEEREREAALFKLDLMREYYTTERTARIMGEGRKMELFSLSGVDLAAGIDINVVRGSAMPKSKVSQQSFIIELFQMGLLGDPNDPATTKKVLRYMDIGGINAVYGSVEIGANLQQMEILGMKDGEYSKVQSFHDHYTHSQECLKELNMPGFKDEPQEFQQMLVRHWQEHIQFITSMMQGIMPGSIEQQKPPPMPGAGGQIGLPEGVNPQAQTLTG